MVRVLAPADPPQSGGAADEPAAIPSDLFETPAAVAALFNRPHFPGQPETAIDIDE